MSEQEFINEHYTQRIEIFNPPFELKEGEMYYFVSKEYGNAKIAHTFSDYKPYEVTDERYEYGEIEFFKKYDEAVKYAKQLFLGETK